ncbi:MAG: hypothetical protein Q4D58_12140, partial [Synergistaceae bacterium]|nr:hypothetical protein [Synergistaceae bacterium]
CYHILMLIGAPQFAACVYICKLALTFAINQMLLVCDNVLIAKVTASSIFSKSRLVQQEVSILSLEARSP